MMYVGLKNSQAIHSHFLAEKRPLTISRQMHSFQEKNSKKVAFFGIFESFENFCHKPCI